MKIIITGSTGFVGRNLIPKLILKNYQILEFTRNLDFSHELFNNQTQKYLIDEDQNELVKTIEEFKPDIIIHLASFLSSLDDYNTLNKLLDSNIKFICRLLDATKKIDLKLFVNTGSFAEYHSGNKNFDPAYLYSATKSASRLFLDYYSKLYNFKQTTVVPYTIYGGIDTQKKIIDIIYDSTLNSNPLDLSPGEQVLDFIHIDDVTDFYIVLIENHHKISQKTNYQLGTGIGHSLKQVAQIVEIITNQKTNINWGGKNYRASDVMFAVADLSEINNTFQWNPKISLLDGVQRLCKSFY
jgi:nucleoside-diphosphate-sugar epimerase